MRSRHLLILREKGEFLGRGFVCHHEGFLQEGVFKCSCDHESALPLSETWVRLSSIMDLAIEQKIDRLKHIRLSGPILPVDDIRFPEAILRFPMDLEVAEPQLTYHSPMMLPIARE